MTRNQIRSRCTEKIEAARQAGRTAFIGYLPAGFPTLQDSIQAAIELGRNGADIIEIGLPYSDPVMDGEVIQKATAHALNNGFHTDQVFQLVNDVTAATDAAVVVMTYWNLVSRLGVTEFARRLAEAGGAGLVTPDLVPEEADEWFTASDRYELDRIFLTAPSSSDERVELVVNSSRGFVYAVSVMGVTGARQHVSEAAQRVVDRAHRAGAPRVCVGLGISQPEHIQQIGRYADGAIVGTALVSALRDHGPVAVGELAAKLATGTARN
ncbi:MULTISPECIES: tryptophan synthase subunit alpha [Auritidibacter]|uniref:Tryptophan synthase alpha chain n=1 Tax=Auritidibacter ignavus TaxID=678932 RepID=A0AAJ6DF72_9MICC|nr:MULTISPECIES: tryptophan synthase subunit alpha [Auritidibacter]AXR73465.1 tryptophan synthase subunit alpha [Auritidibacter sp. NML130574]PXA80366.1 tryptophan synthase subunit alpha [Auritidibacter sp. NML120636]WGH82046.1 tryptophan synthase subunit alpha [Auritidibacter ignavus]WGH84306.1 tryptophan synthase subunit alpha [Auritidibacter ignavus]WGH86652.1 tryptophan synthase subunit alpha [Auritidibacter ignavus]